MSLIDEALKRARAEADRQTAAQRSAASRWVPSHPLSRRRSRTLLWAGAAAACLAAGVAVGLGVSALSEDGAGDRERQTRRSTVAAEAPEGLREEDQAGGGRPPALLFEELGTTEAPGAGANTLEPLDPLAEMIEPGEEAPAPLPGPSSSPGAASTAAPPPGPAGVDPSLPSPSSPGRPEESPRPAPPPAAGAQPAPQPRPTAPEPAATYVRRAPLPGGGEIALGGIAFSANQPVALLNGKVVGVGEVVEGMTVVAISPGRVDLAGRGTTLALLIE
jgi:hypothetical protein